jgi:hypothetical protein
MGTRVMLAEIILSGPHLFESSPSFHINRQKPTDRFLSDTALKKSDVDCFSAI